MHIPSPAVAMRTLPLALLLTACGDISNAFLLEDTEFLDALPSSARQTVSIEPEGAKGWLDHAPTLLVVSYEVSTSVNDLLLGVLDTMDYVRTLRPSERTEDARRWGPYPYKGVDVEVWNTRTGAGRFDWGVDALADAGTLTYIAGTHYAGDSVAAGDGQFTWRLGDAAERVGEPARGTLVVDYDNRAGIDLLVDIQGVTDGTTAPLTALYAYRLAEGEGDFQYTFSADVNDDGLVEDCAIRTRWNVGLGGRADALVTGGSLGDTVERWSQCWDAAVYLVYEADDQGFVTPVGAEGDCSFPSFAEVDRI